MLPHPPGLPLMLPGLHLTIRCCPLPIPPLGTGAPTMSTTACKTPSLRLAASSVSRPTTSSSSKVRAIGAIYAPGRAGAWSAANRGTGALLACQLPHNCTAEKALAWPKPAARQHCSPPPPTRSSHHPPASPAGEAVLVGYGPGNGGDAASSSGEFIRCALHGTAASMLGASSMQRSKA